MPNWLFKFKETFYRFAATGAIPAWLFERRVPRTETLEGRTGKLHIEIVSHCWRYSHLLRFQLSSVLLYPPQNTHLTLTIVHSPEDTDTVELLAFYAAKSVPNVTWNFVAVEKPRLFRRAIGRNLRAKATQADWIFFSDCDQMFYRDSIDQLATALQGRSDPLLFPRIVQCSLRVHSAEEVLRADQTPTSKWIVEADAKYFQPVSHDKAVGGTQIVHGDVARTIGYCEVVPFYQQPVGHWHKTYEDRVFRWLLGTHGEAIEVPHIYRIEHHQKGRYAHRVGPAWLRPFLSNAGRGDLIAKLFKKKAPPADEASRRAA
jgi:hypothetical protein